MTGEKLNVNPDPKIQQEVGRVNNELGKGSGQETSPIQREIGLIRNEREDTVQHVMEIGRINNELPGTKKPEQPEIGVIHNELESTPKS